MMPALPKVVGIVNITPDSFSDGGAFNAPDAALKHMQKLLEDGADVLDLGAESTRPNATPLTANEEWNRLESILTAARREFPSATLSVDTYHAQTADRALNEGANWINDVSGGADPEMISVISKFPSCMYVYMHALSIPADPKVTLPEDVDVVAEISQWMIMKLRQYEQAGIAKSQLIADPGIGFGKTAKQSIEILRRIRELVEISAVPLFVGHSRKSFLADVNAIDAKDRDVETHVISTHLAECGVEFVRVHDVAGTCKALRAHQLVKG